jgi:hypothetical protein
VLEEWRKRELKKANDGKVGEPCLPLPGVVHQAPRLRQAPLPPASPAGRPRGSSTSSLGSWRGCRPQTTPQSTGGSTNRLQIDLDESLIRSNEPVSIAVDSSGVKVHNGGDWIRHVWKVKKGYLKIHFAVDIRTGQVVSMDVSSEKVGDGKRLKRLVNRASENVRVGRVLADGAYDSKANFNFLAGEGIKPVIRVRKGSVQKSYGSYARKLAVVEQQAFKPRSWSNIHRFGYRWRVEGAFSVIKRVFGEYVTAKKFVNMAREMAMKASIYNGFIKAMA